MLTGPALRRPTEIVICQLHRKEARMPKFNYNDIVKIRSAAEPGTRHDRAWIVGIFEERPGKYFDKFPGGVVYTIEFEDGTSTEVHENSLEPAMQSDAVRAPSADLSSGGG
jgi:hypothetical protein